MGWHAENTGRPNPIGDPVTPLDPVPAAIAHGTGRAMAPLSSTPPSSAPPASAAPRGTDAVAEWCRALARWLLLGRRLSRGAPETRALREELAFRLAELVQARGEFTLDVTPRSLVLGDTPVFVAEHANDARPGRGLEHELSWVLHRDGIRRLHFRRGLTRESARGFLDAIAQAAPASATHEDVVTLLWDAPPAGIGWEAEEVGGAEGSEPRALPHDPHPPVQTIEDLSMRWRDEEQPRSRGDAFATAWRTEHEPPFAERSAALVEELLARESGEGLVPVLIAALATWLATATQRGDWVEAREALALIERVDPERRQSRPALEHALSGLDVAAITDRLDSDAHELQAQAFALAVRIGAPALPLLVAILGQSGRTRVRAGATTALAFAFAEDPAPLAVLLADPRWQVVRDTVFVLGQIGGPAVVPLLAQAGRHVDARVRRVAIEALGQVPAAQARPVLWAQLDSQDVRALRSALAMLARDPDAPTAGAVIARVISPSFTTRSEEQRVALISALPDLAGDDAIPALTQCLHEGGWFARPSAERNAAARALRQLDTPAARSLLAQGARHRASAVRDACTQVTHGGPGA